MVGHLPPLPSKWALRMGQGTVPHEGMHHFVYFFSWLLCVLQRGGSYTFGQHRDPVLQIRAPAQILSTTIIKPLWTVGGPHPTVKPSPLLLLCVEAEVRSPAIACAWNRPFLHFAALLTHTPCCRRCHFLPRWGTADRVTKLILAQPDTSCRKVAKIAISSIAVQKYILV